MKIINFGNADKIEPNQLFIAHIDSNEGRRMAVLEQVRGINASKEDAIDTIHHLLKQYGEQVPMRTLADIEEILSAVANIVDKRGVNHLIQIEDEVLN
jgi:hypothetical protein